MKRIFKRKLYDRLQKWKDTRNGKTAILVEGACRKINIGGAIRQERICLVYTYRLQQGIKKGHVPIR